MPGDRQQCIGATADLEMVYTVFYHNLSAFPTIEKNKKKAFNPNCFPGGMNDNNDATANWHGE